MSPPPPIAIREQYREQRFSKVWTLELNDVFADVAPYYDRGNLVASLGLWNRFLDSFMAIIELNPGERALDVCGGTNAIGIALLKREPTLQVHAIDRSAAMQEVGRQRAEALGFHIDSTIGDVHKLPFPDNHFDIVTLQYASRHLRVRDVFTEIRRVLKPGGRFYHSDMLRPDNPVVKALYYTYLRFSLSFTSLICKSGSAAQNCKQYFIDALDNFYSVEEMSSVLRDLRFSDVSAKTIMVGMIGFHRAVKPQPD
ncbi:MAG: methyltransferase domain-containing protein [Rhodocyclaceae bacterium]|nr:MAG: methyltransferase domain-containing protein [Rhodocyclaceae bacterium]